MSFQVCLFAASLAGVLCAGLIPCMRRLGVRLGAFTPGGERHVHQAKIPRTGGLALFVSFFCTLGLVYLLDIKAHEAFQKNPGMLMGFVGGALSLCALGLFDDLYGVRAPQKLLLQTLVSLGLYACGVRFEMIHLPWIGSYDLGFWALPCTVLWIVGIVNAINLIDGLDGLASGIALCAGLTNLVVALLVGSSLVALLLAVLIGTLLGFLLYNFNPARIFMGDSGSYFVGFVLATTSLCGSMQRTSITISILVPILSLGVPLFDTLLTLVRRFVEGKALLAPDRGHIHHRLLDMGLTHRKAVLVLYGLSALLACAAIGFAVGRSWEIGLCICLTSVAALVLLRISGLWHLVRQRRHTSDTTAHATSSSPPHQHP